MAGQARGPKARNYGGGGGGGNLLLNLAGAYFGMPEMNAGGMLAPEEMAAMGGPEAVIAEDAPVYQKPTIKKDGFWSQLGKNIATKGAYGQNLAQLDAKMKLGEYDNVLKQALIDKQLTGAADNIRLKAALDEANAPKEYARKREQAILESALQNKLGTDVTLLDKVLAPNTVAGLNLGTTKANLEQAAYNTPDMQTAHVKDMYAKLAQQVLANQKIRGDILDANKKRPTLGFMGVGPDAMVEPETGRSFMFQKPLMEEPVKGYEGGLKEINLSNFKKTPGGLDAEQQSFKGVPEMLRRPTTSAATQSFQPSLIPSMESLIPSVANSLPSPMPVTPGLVQAGKQLINAIPKPQVDTNRIMQDWGPIINAVPLFEDFLKKKGMFAPKQ